MEINTPSFQFGLNLIISLTVNRLVHTSNSLTARLDTFERRSEELVAHQIKTKTNEYMDTKDSLKTVTSPTRLGNSSLQ